MWAATDKIEARLAGVYCGFNLQSLGSHAAGKAAVQHIKSRRDGMHEHHSPNGVSGIVVLARS